jgi:ABC-type transport system involved in multi-copper enzyme maturation permease subunit
MPAATLIRLTLLDAWRGGLPWLAGASLLAAAALAAFVAQLALTESRELQAAILAALLRACAVFLIAVQVSSSALRELNDKALEMMLALPLARATHYLGRLGGYVLCGTALAAAFSLALALWAPAHAVALWGVSLACELALVCAAALFFTMSLARPVAALAATLGLYLLARSMAAIQSIAAGPLAEASLAHDVARWGVDAVALVLPRLDAATRTEWLLYGAPSAAGYAAALSGLAIYTALLVVAGLFDFQRRNF